jgi:hypothetical protein
LQGPQRGGARAGAAERQHRAGHVLQRARKLDDVRILQLARHDRNMPVVQARRPRRRLQGLTGRLVIRLAIRAVVDDTAKALRSERDDVGRADLRGDAQLVGEFLGLHGVNLQRQNQPAMNGIRIIGDGDQRTWGRRRLISRRWESSDNAHRCFRPVACVRHAY